jgi:ferredoxin-type protein NapH
MRQRIRLLLVYTALLLFPVTLNFFSPYVSIDGAMNGLVAGSVFVFAGLFVSGLFLGRAWCGWLCPMAGMAEIGAQINKKPANVRRLTFVRYAIFAVWFGILVTFFVLAGGIKGFDPLHLTERFISVDEPMKYITYYLVLFTFFGLNLWLGKRGACHGICWMSPFMVGGYLVGRLVRLPQLRIKSDATRCTDCKTCTGRCPMGIPVNEQVKVGVVSSLDCILCGQCVDGCPNRVLSFGFRR